MPHDLAVRHSAAYTDDHGGGCSWLAVRKKLDDYKYEFLAFAISILTAKKGVFDGA